MDIQGHTVDIQKEIRMSTIFFSINAAFWVSGHTGHTLFFQNFFYIKKIVVSSSTHNVFIKKHVFKSYIVNLSVRVSKYSKKGFIINFFSGHTVIFLYVH